MFADLNQLLVAGRTHGDAPCFTFIPDGRSEAAESISFRNFVDRSLRIAAGLRACGAGSGTRVALFAPPDVDYMTTMAAALLCGATVAPINHLFRARELVSYLGLVDPVVLAHRADDGVAASAPASLTRLVFGESASSAAVRLADLVAHDRAEPTGVDPDDAAFIMHTSGTTGLPKGVVRSHGTYASFVDLWARDFMGADDSVLSFMPMYHQGGVMMSFLPAYALGNPTHQLERFSPATFWEAARHHRTKWAVFMPPVPSFLLLADPPRDHQFEWAMTGGRVDHWSEMQRRFGVSGHSGYGSTETTMVTMTGTRQDGPAQPGVLSGPRGGYACGRPIPDWNEVRVVREDGTPAGPLEHGELEFSGRGVFREYFRNPDATARAFTADGWFRPGDIGYTDASGQLFMVDRSRDVIRRSGENISPREIEDVLVDHPAVAEAAVVAVEDELRGQEIRACVVLEPGAEVSPAQLFEHCAGQLSPFKVPRYLDLRSELPHTPTLKVRKEELISNADRSSWIDRLHLTSNQPVVAESHD